MKVYHATRHEIINLILLTAAWNWQQCLIFTFIDAKLLTNDIVQLHFVHCVLRADVAVENHDIDQIVHSKFCECFPLLLVHFKDDWQIVAVALAFRPHYEHFNARAHICSELRKVILE